MRSPVARLGVAVVALSAVVGAVVYAQAAKPRGAQMAEKATALLASLDADQKKAATFPLDDPHRAAWWFTPQQTKEKQPTRKGVRLDKLSAEQKTGVMDLLKLGLSEKGFDQAGQIMNLESLLKELEGETGANHRDPQWYFLSIFGEPNATGLWGWRVEGHHLSVNITVDKGEVVQSTPIVFGVNPAEVRDGAKKGQRVTPEIEETAKALIAALTDDQAKAAKQAKQLGEIKEGVAAAGVGEPVGIAATDLKDEQKKLLRKLIGTYAARLPEDVAATELKKVEATFDKIRFAYCIEEAMPGKPYTYRVQGPTFVIEFLNVQADSAKNPANHIHSGWRTLPKDF